MMALISLKKRDFIEKSKEIRGFIKLMGAMLDF
jgi:hypothetical protein